MTVKENLMMGNMADRKQGFLPFLFDMKTAAMEEKLMNVPLSAVFGDSENRKTYVWVVEGNKVSRREVTVYSPTGEANLLISKGLEPGETVVTAGVYQLTEGEAIKVLM